MKAGLILLVLTITAQGQDGKSVKLTSNATFMYNN